MRLTYLPAWASRVRGGVASLSRAGLPSLCRGLTETWNVLPFQPGVSSDALTPTHGGRLWWVIKPHAGQRDGAGSTPDWPVCDELRGRAAWGATAVREERGLRDTALGDGRG